MHGPSNWFPSQQAPSRRSDNLELRSFSLGTLTVPLLCEVQERDSEDVVGYGRFDTTGFTLWPASTLIAGLVMAMGTKLCNTDVLDLGCGTGFCGIVASRFARKAVLSDREPRMLSLARQNARLQSDGVAVTARYGWGANDAWPPERGGFGLVLASDVLYSSHEAMRYDATMLRRFVELLDWSLAPGGTVLISHVERNSRGLEDVMHAARRRFRVQLLDPSECVGDAVLNQRGNVGVRSASVLRCSRESEVPELGPL
jgi:SAM-dependent methyltransferase